VHYVRDVTMGEDANQTHVGHAPHVLAALRNAILNLFRRHGWTNIAAAFPELWRLGVVRVSVDGGAACMTLTRPCPRTGATLTRGNISKTCRRRLASSRRRPTWLL